MWLASSDEQLQQVFCEICRNKIDQLRYIKHWKSCATLKSATNIIKANEAQNQVEDEEYKIQCPYCRTVLSFEVLDSHQQECQLSKIQCQNCNQKINMQLFNQHQKNCKRPLPRPTQMPMMNFLNSKGFNSFHQLLMSYLQSTSRQNNDGNNEQQDLRTTLFEGLKNIGKGMKKQEIKSLPVVKFKAQGHQHHSCAICQQDFNEDEKIIKLKCKHVYHQQCAYNWLIKSASCPICVCSAREK